MAETRQPHEINRAYEVARDFPKSTLIPSGKDGIDGGGSYGFNHRTQPIISVIDPDIPASEGGNEVEILYPNGERKRVKVDDINKAVVTPASGLEPTIKEVEMQPSVAESEANVKVAKPAPVKKPVKAPAPALVQSEPAPPEAAPVIEEPEWEPQWVPPKLKVTFEGGFGKIRSKFHEAVLTDKYLALVYRTQDADDELEYEPAESPTAVLTVSIPSNDISVAVKHFGITLNLQNDGLIVLMLFRHAEQVSHD